MEASPSTGEDRSTVDARGLKCPLPVVKTKLGLELLEPGDLLRVLATDPEAPVDITAWCEDAGHELVAQTAGADGFEFLIRKRATPAGPGSRQPATGRP